MENFNTDESFWIVHPVFKTAGPFKELYTKDKSRNKENSSRLAWAIKLIWNRKSDFYNLPEVGEDNKIDLVFEDFYGDVSYYVKNRDKVEALKDFYLLTTETVAKRTLRGIEDKLLERDRFIRNTPYEQELVDGEYPMDVNEWAKRIDTIDKMMERTEKIYNLYEKARRVVEQEEQQVTMGGAQESLTDGDLI